MSALSRRAMLGETTASGAVAMLPAIARASAAADPALATPGMVKAADHAVSAAAEALEAVSVTLPPQGHPLRPAYDAAQESFNEACSAHWDLWSVIADISPTTLQGAGAKAEALRLMMTAHNADNHGNVHIHDFDGAEYFAWSLAADIERLVVGGAA